MTQPMPCHGTLKGQHRARSERSSMNTSIHWRPMALSRWLLLMMVTVGLASGHSWLTEQERQSEGLATLSPRDASPLVEGVQTPQAFFTTSHYLRTLFLLVLLSSSGWVVLEYAIALKAELAKKQAMLKLVEHDKSDLYLQVKQFQRQIDQEKDKLYQDAKQLQRQVGKKQAELNQEIQQLQQQITQHQQQVEQLEARLESQSLDQVSPQIAILEAQLQEKQEAKQEAYEQLDIERSQFSQKRAAIEAELKVAQDETESLRQQRQYLAQEKHDLQQHIYQLNRLEADLQRKIKALEEDVELSVTLNAELEHEIETLRQELQTQQQNSRIHFLEWRIQEAIAERLKTEEELRQLKASQVAIEQSYSFNNLSEVLTQIETEFGDVLEIWDSAKRAAAAVCDQKKGKFKKVYWSLRAIAEIGRIDLECRAHGIPMGKSWEEAMAEKPDIGSKYRPHESQATLDRYGEQRRFSHQGQAKIMTQHMTITGRAGALQIYFAIADNKIQIGYCGPHLDYVNHDT